jgi:hypothetical protein
MSRILAALLALLLAAVSLAADEPNPNIRFGLPAPAKADSEASREAFLIVRPQYVLSYLRKTVPAVDRPKYDGLRKAIQEQLTGVKVYKVGDESERNVYIVGKSKEGKWAGLKTTVVET